ncbi:MAG: peptide ABC transporter substrate-binding protein [Alphaproteobacteria bacterium]|nr:peptide ABC transporter substrate-binding protein [Alphaproteobacteria bacterium]
MAKTIVSFLFCLALALAGALQPARAGEAHKTFTIGISQFPSTMHPDFDDMVAKTLVLSTALRPMTVHDAAWRPICMLCVEIPSYENGLAKDETYKDGKETKPGIAATYTLKPDLFWGDGTPVTTKDILFAWEIGKNPKSGVGNGEFFAKDIRTIEAKDDRTFTIHFSKRQCSFAQIDDFYPLPAHLEKKIFEKDPASYMRRTLYATAPATAGLYFGPYVVSKLDQGAAITLARNPYWKGEKPAFDKVVFRTIENSAALSAALLAGDIDYIAGELGLTLDEAISFEKRLNRTKPGQFKTIYKPGLTYEHIDLNLDQPPFDDVTVRQALMYAMNRKALNDQMFDGRQPIALSDVNPLDTVYAGDVTQYPYDPQKAGALLDAAGWKMKPDGFRYGKDGQKLSITLSTTAGNKSRELIEQAIQADWRAVGIDVSISNQPARVLFGDTMRKRSFRGGVMYAWLSSPQNIPKTTLYSTMIPTEANNYAGQNYTGYNNPVMDKIIDDMEVVCEKDKNLALWHDLQEIYATDLPALPLYYRANSYFIPVWLHGLVPTGHMNPSTLWIENWSASP